jgi:hypothetical protein
MTNIFYFLTSLEDALTFADKKVLFDFTYFTNRAEAVKGVQKLKTVGIPLIAKLELDDEVEQPKQVDPGYWTQVGYQPPQDKDKEQQYRLKFRRKHLSRISVVSWDNMQDNVHDKETQIKKIVRGNTQIMDYDNDHHQDYDTMVADDGDEEEAFRVAVNFTQFVGDFDTMRKTHGLTLNEQEILLSGRQVGIEFPLHLYGAVARKYAKKAEEAELPESKESFMQKASLAFCKFEFLRQQQTSTLIKSAQSVGLFPEQTMLEMGHDEFQQIDEGNLSLNQIIKQQYQADGRRPPEEKPHIWLP